MLRLSDVNVESDREFEMTKETEEEDHDDETDDDFQLCPKLISTF
jgi:hypothetical protein